MPTYLVTGISRALSSGSESYNKKIFATLEEAATYIHDVWYDEFCNDFEFPVPANTDIKYSVLNIW